MQNTYAKSILNNPQPLFWSTYIRVLHWVTAITLVAYANYTGQEYSWHSTLGWMALGLLLMLQIIYTYSAKTNWALWFVTALVSAINLSGWLSPDHSSHFLVTLSGVMLAAFYFATVVFESISLLINRIYNQGHVM